MLLRLGRCLINGYRCIQNAIDQLTQKQKDKHGKFRRWIDSERTEGDIRRMIENIDRSSTAYTVSFSRDGE